MGGRVTSLAPAWGAHLRSVPLAEDDPRQKQKSDGIGYPAKDHQPQCRPKEHHSLQELRLDEQKTLTGSEEREDADQGRRRIPDHINPRPTEDTG